MSDDHATLDDFLDADGGASADERTPEAEESDPAADPDPEQGSAPVTDDGPNAATGEAVDPAESTYRWSGAGARCDGCGAHVERLWRDEPGLVCGDCKDW